MKKEARTIDFGASPEFGVHIFKVEIPRDRSGPVTIMEDYGYKGGAEGIPQFETRVILERAKWSAIADPVRIEFNARLKSHKLPSGRWHVGTNLVERLLGRELCVLAWAVETAGLDQVPIIVRRWLALRPEERWWLFSQIVAEAGLPDDRERGWRKAIYYALSDAKGFEERPKRRRPKELIRLPIKSLALEKSK